MAETERRLLAREAGRAGGGQVVHQGGVFGLFAAPLERVLELVVGVEMILDDALVAASDKDEMLNPSLPRLVHDILEDRPVDDGQHLLWNRLGRRQETGPETSDGQYGFANGFVHGCSVPRSMRGWQEASGANS